MNIFVTNPDPHLSAIALDDKRLIKMILESAQILSTAIWINGHKGFYKPTHLNHPVVKWASSSQGNYEWLMQHFIHLIAEYNYRFNRTHKCSTFALQIVLGQYYIPSRGGSSFCNCTTNKEKGISFKHITDTPEAYKNYLNARWETDKRTPKWTKRGKPEWVRVSLSKAI